MDRYEETFETWNKVATLYEDKFMELDIYNETYDYFCNAIKEIQPNLLEIGCGPGNITKYLLSQRPDFQIFGIDIASNMIELAKKNNPQANFAIMDIRKIDELTTKYDGLVCGFCLPYLSEIDCEKLILDAHHLLNDGGLIYISFVEGETNKSAFQVRKNGDRSYFYYHDGLKLKEQLNNHSFEELRTFKVNYKKSETDSEIHTILIAKKKKMA